MRKILIVGILALGLIFSSVLVSAHNGNGAGDGTGNDGEGPQDGTGYGPGGN